MRRNTKGEAAKLRRLARERQALEAAFTLLEAAKLTPYDLYAYAAAMDVIEYRDEVRRDALDSNNSEVAETMQHYTVADALEETCDMELEGARDVVVEFYGRVGQMLDAHFKEV